VITTDRIRLDQELLKGLRVVGFEIVNKDLRSIVAVSPTLSGDYHLNEVKSRIRLSPKDYFRLSVLHWYLDPEVAFLLRLMIEQEWTTGPLSEYKNSLLISKESMLATLQIQEIWNGNTFFGDLRSKSRTNQWKQLLECLYVPRKPQKVKSVQRKRGYHDKGSLSPVHKSKTYDYRKFQDDFDIAESVKWNTAFADRIERLVLYQLEHSQ
jgi:hypothetical protein